MFRFRKSDPVVGWIGFESGGFVQGSVAQADLILNAIPTKVPKKKLDAQRWHDIWIIFLVVGTFNMSCSGWNFWGGCIVKLPIMRLVKHRSVRTALLMLVHDWDDVDMSSDDLWRSWPGEVQKFALMVENRKKNLKRSLGGRVMTTKVPSDKGIALAS